MGRFHPGLESLPFQKGRRARTRRRRRRRIMATGAWEKLLVGQPWFRSYGRFPISAYSEYLPPPYIGPKPYGIVSNDPRIEGDPNGWGVSEYEEAFELHPGLEKLARRAVDALSLLSRGQHGHGL